MAEALGFNLKSKTEKYYEKRRLEDGDSGHCERAERDTHHTDYYELHGTRAFLRLQ